MKHVPRVGRVLDLAGLALLLVGGGFFARAWVGFRRVPAIVPDPEGEPWATVQLADGYLRLQRIGGGLMVVAALVFVAAWWVGGRRRRRPEPGD